MKAFSRGDEEGHVAVYGIHFDVDKASLRLGAE